MIVACTKMLVLEVESGGEIVENLHKLVASKIKANKQFGFHNSLHSSRKRKLKMAFYILPKQLTWQKKNCHTLC